MGLKEQYLQELNSIKDERKERVIEAAKLEFGKTGITNSKLSKIAARAKIGEASLYRYFKNKTELASVVATSYWDESSKLFENEFMNKIALQDNALDKIKVYLSIFLEFYKNHKEFLKYMNEFDIFMMANDSSFSNFAFDNHINDARDFYALIIQEGQENGTIRLDIDGYQKYDFSGQVMVGLVTKLALRVGYLPSESDIDHIQLIEETIDMFINYIKA